MLKTVFQQVLRGEVEKKHPAAAKRQAVEALLEKSARDHQTVSEVKNAVLAAHGMRAVAVAGKKNI